MTPEEFDKIKWTFQSHLNMGDEHASTYRADTPFPLFACRHVTKNYTKYGNERFRTTVHYKLDGKVYKTKEKLLEAIKEL